MKDNCKHLWAYGNIAVKNGPHPRVRECTLCKAFEYVKTEPVGIQPEKDYKLGFHERGIVGFSIEG